jgi:uncharacterized protein (TIGR02679 family)
MPGADELSGPLGGPALLPLWREVHARLGSGRPIGRVRVDMLGDEGRRALADVLGTVRYPDRPVAFRELETAVWEIAGADVRSVVERLLGPVDERAARRADDAAARAELWAWLGGHPVVLAQPALGEWVAGLRRAGVSSVGEARALFEDALRVLGRLPADGVPLPAFAQQVLGRTHALDGGERLTGVVLRAVAAILDVDTPSGAQARRALWERMGVAEDQLSSTVLVAGVRPRGPGLVAALLRTCADAGEAASLTLAQVRRDDDLRLPEGTVVHAVENPSMMAMAVARFGPACPPLVCTSGWPSSAAARFLSMIARHHRIRYHGDLDGDGVRIATYMHVTVGAQPWRMSAADYRAEVPDAGPPVGRVTEAPWDPALADAMREHGIALTEEHVAELLLADLRAGGG